MIYVNYFSKKLKTMLISSKNPQINIQNTVLQVNLRVVVQSSCQAEVNKKNWTPYIYVYDFLQMDWLDILAVQGTLKSLQHHSSKASILRCSAFFTVQLSHPYMTTGKTIALTRRTFVGKVMSLLLNMLSRLVIAFLQNSKCLLIS